MGTNQRTQIRMTEEEIETFISSSRTATLATVGPHGIPHLVAMWYAVIDGELWFETKAKSQKAQNIMRNPTISCMIEDGLTYDCLRGISIEGTAEVIDDPEALWKVGVSMWERYYGPYSDDMSAGVTAMLNKRIALRVKVSRIRSWDHRKLGIPPIPISGSTAH